MKEEEKNILEEEETLKEEEIETGNVENPEDAEESEDAKESEDAEEKDPLEAALEEIEQLKTQILYKTAEFDNYRKRTLKEKAELILNGGEKAVSAILPVIDDMERAMENGEKTEDPAVLREGTGEPGCQEDRDGQCRLQYRPARGCGNGSRYGRRQERQSHRLSADRLSVE